MDRTATGLKKEGNSVFAEGNVQRALKLYKTALSASSDDEKMLKSQIHSNIALMYLKLRKPIPSKRHCREGLALFPEDEKLSIKLKHRLEQGDLLEEIQNNYKKSCEVSVESPTSIIKGTRLFRAISDQSQYFYQSQYITTNESDARFFVSPGILTCVVVFAMHRRTSGRNVCYAAHIDLENLLASERAGRRLKELKDSITSTFSGLQASEVEAHIVGGHKFDTKHGLMKKIVKCVKSLGYSVSTEIANKFDGAPLGPDWVSVEYPRLLSEGQQFLIAALDTESGYVVTHNSVEEDSPLSLAHQQKVREYTMGLKFHRRLVRREC